MMRFAPSCFARAETMMEMPGVSPMATTAQSISFIGNVSMASRLEASRAIVCVMLSFQRSVTSIVLSMPITSWPRATNLVASDAPKLPNPNTMNFIAYKFTSLSLPSKHNLFPGILIRQTPCLVHQGHDDGEGANPPHEHDDDQHYFAKHRKVLCYPQSYARRAECREDFESNPQHPLVRIIDPDQEHGKTHDEERHYYDSECPVDGRIRDLGPEYLGAVLPS